MSLEYEPSSERLHISAEQFFLNWEPQVCDMAKRDDEGCFLISSQLLDPSLPDPVRHFAFQLRAHLVPPLFGCCIRIYVVPWSEFPIIPSYPHISSAMVGVPHRPSYPHYRHP